MTYLRDLGTRGLAVVLVALALVGCSREPINESAFMEVIETLCAPEMEGRDAGTQGIELARDYLVEQFKDAGLEPAFVIDGEPSYTQPFEVVSGRDAEGKPVKSTVDNVGGLLPGVGELADQVVVVGGHYDHVGYGHIGSRDKEAKGTIHPGADDNASGTAGFVLLARHFAQRQRDPDAPRRTILFTGFAGEERGLLGARYMTSHPDEWAFDAENISGMINMDMVGRLRHDELYIFTDKTGEQWRDWTNDANQDVGLKLMWGIRPPGGSDHSMFIRTGVPAVFFNTWLHPDYHTPNDTPDKINAEGGVKVLRLVAGLLEQTVTSDERVVFVQPTRMPPTPYLGVRMEFDKRGVLLVEVPKGSMSKAGGLPGDILLSMGGEAMRTPGDVRGFIARSEPGDEVVVELIREGEPMKLDVRLDLRR